VRLLRLVEFDENKNELSLVPKKLQFWRTVTDKIRVGKLFVSMYDIGKSVEILSVDYAGNEVDRVDIPYSEIREKYAHTPPPQPPPEANP
jgi:hypothetical protein